MTVRLSLALRRRFGLSHGAAFVELAASILVLVIVLVGTADFARVYHHVIDLSTAARAGAQYGAASLANSGDTAAMQAAAVAAAPDTALTAVASRTCWCATDDAATFTGGVSCTVECPTGPPEQHLVVTVTVNASYTFRTFANIAPTNFTVTRTATLRAQ